MSNTYEDLLEKIDPFLAEFQRFQPLIIDMSIVSSILVFPFSSSSSLKTHTQTPNPTVAPQRRLLPSLTLKDGTVLPKSIRIGLPCHAVHFDSEANESADTFDGYRLYRRQAKMVQTHMDHLLFGYSRRTCPGRFWAVSEVKMILAKILVGMDFRPALHGESSKTYFINELSFMDPRTKQLMRARSKVSDR